MLFLGIFPFLLHLLDSNYCSMPIENVDVFVIPAEAGIQNINKSNGLPGQAGQ